MKALGAPSKRKTLIIALITCGIVVTAMALVAFYVHQQSQAQGAPRLYWYRNTGPASACESQLGLIGFSIDTEDGYSGEGKPEFTSLAGSQYNPPFDPNRIMFVARTSEDPGKTLAQLGSQPHVVSAEAVYTHSADPTYFSCDYKLRGSPAAQALADKARQALTHAGADASVLSNAGTVEIVSVRHFGQKAFLEAAFVYLPANGPHVAYAALFDKNSRALVWVGQAHWYS